MDKIKPCTKIRFQSRSEAKKHLKNVNRTRTYGKNQKTVYYCGVCDCYHTSSMTKTRFLKSIKKTK